MMMELLLPYYSYASYRNGFRREDRKDVSDGDRPNILSFETGFYTLEVDINDLTKIHFGPNNDNGNENQTCACYQDVVMTTCCTTDLTELPLNIELAVGSETYKCKSMTPGPTPNKPFNKNVILWEAGKVSQRFDLLNLQFDDDSLPLTSTWKLSVQIWPDAFCFTVTGDRVSDAPMDITIAIGTDGKWTKQKCVVPDNGRVSTSLHCTLVEGRPTVPNLIKVTTVVKDDGMDPVSSLGMTSVHALETTYNPVLHAYETTVEYGYTSQAGKLVRTFAAGYTDIRDYDDYHIRIQDDNQDLMIPFVLSMGMPANVTGMCPMILVEHDGYWVPSGIPVQMSKNWHWSAKGAYAKIYAVLPASCCNYKLRITYGFYGTLPAASHAQLCLYGYGDSTGRWDQLALGCWGETFCLDSEMTCGVENTITDVRGLFMASANDAKWTWSHCAWGGDWMSARDADTGKRLYATNVKVAYLAHGPCMTNVVFHGFYGSAVEFTVTVRTVRTDDYCRTFFHMEYTVHGTVTIEYLHNMLNRAFHTPTVAYGNGTCLVEEREVPDGLTQNEVFVENQTWEGMAPYWITFPNSKQFPSSKKQMPDGFKTMIVQSFEASVGETCFKNPAFSLKNELSSWAPTQGEQCSLYINVELPDAVTTLQDGDWIRMETEWTTHSREASSYYGPNTIYKNFLVANPKSWKIPFREVQWNGSILKYQKIEGGEIVHHYPLQVNVTAPVVTIHIDGGVGGFPMQFCHLPDTNSRLYKVAIDGKETLVDQSHLGNDYWQTDYDFRTQTYTMTFTPMLGREWASIWRLKKI